MKNLKIMLSEEEDRELGHVVDTEGDNKNNDHEKRHPRRLIVHSKSILTPSRSSSSLFGLSGFSQPSLVASTPSSKQHNNQQQTTLEEILTSPKASFIMATSSGFDNFSSDGNSTSEGEQYHSHQTAASSSRHHQLLAPLTFNKNPRRGSFSDALTPSSSLLFNNSGHFDGAPNLSTCSSTSSLDSCNTTSTSLSSSILNHTTSGDNYSSTLKTLENILPSFFTPFLPPHTSHTYYSEYYWDEHPLSLTTFSPILHFERKLSLTIICKYTPRSETKRERQNLLVEGEVYCLKISLDKSTVPLLERDSEISTFLQKQLCEEEGSDSSSLLTPLSSHVIANIKAYLSDYFILVRDFVDGVSLRTYIERSKIYARALPINVDNFDSILTDSEAMPNEEMRVEENIKIFQSNLDLAISICLSLSQLHHLRVCHGDIKPENIICAGPERSIKMIDFGLSNFLSLEHPFLYTDKLIGSAMYCSPEATGKVPKPIGFYSDLYSLGFVLFEIFSKEHPFTKFKVSDYMFYHLTQQPETLFQNLKRKGFILDNEKNLFTSAVKSISRIITKVTQKSIDMRYLSIFGLKRDLVFVQDAIKSKDVDSLENFIAGMNDVQTTLTIPYGVYGRDDILEKLDTALESMMEMSEPKIVLFSGYSGIGKSCIVKEFRNRCKYSVQFFDAKYDQNHNVPYFALIAISRLIIEDVLGESDAVIKNFRFQFGTLLNADQLEMLQECIPDLSYLFTVSEKRQSLLMGRDQHDERVKLFSQAIIHLFSVYTHLKRKRLCIFLDDLQWTDFDSMRLLKEILGSGSCDTIPLLLIGAYRDNEVDSSHPLHFFIESLKQKIFITEIEVKELTEEQSNMIVSESLRKKVDETTSLTKILFSRTNGNPFFLKQLLAGLVKDGSIYFDTHSDTLTWNVEKIEQAQYSQNVVDYLLKHLSTLPKRTKDTLACASCIGNTFSYDELLMLLNHEHKSNLEMFELKELLNYAVKEGWVSSNINACHMKFNHDRLQQAAYESLSESEKSCIHYAYGMQILSKAQRGEISLDERVFDIVIQLNHKSKDPIILSKKEDRRLLVELNVKASKKALDSSSTDHALSFISTARDILKHEEDCWGDETYPMAFDCLLMEGNCNYANNVGLATSLYVEAIRRSNTKSDLYEACNQAIMAYLSQGQYENVFNILMRHVFTTYEELYFLTQENTAEELVAWIQQKMKDLKENILINFCRKSDILNLPNNEDTEKLHLITLMTQSCPAVYHMNNPLSKYIFMVMVLISGEIVLQNGLSPLSSLLLTIFGWSWCNFEFYPQMNMFIEAGVELERNRYKSQHELAGCILLKLMSYHISPSINPLEVWNISEEAFLLAIKSKNKHFGGFSILWYPFHHFFYSHGDIKTSIGLSLNSIEIFRKNDNLMLMDASKMVLEMKYVLSGDIDRYEPNYSCNVKEYPFFRQLHFMFKGISEYFQNSIEESFRSMEKSYSFREDSIGMTSTWIDAIFQGLAATKYLKNSEATRVSKAEEMLNYSLDMLKKVSLSNPSIFMASYELVSAEKLVSEYLRTGKENTKKIIAHYKKSLEFAEKERNNFLLRIINLNMGEFYDSLGMDDGISGYYFLRAMDSFEQFGASITVDYILREYSKHIEAYGTFSHHTNVEKTGFSNSSISDETGEHSLAGVTKSRISESSELDFREIFISILPILAEQTMSSRCCLILKRDSTIYLDAEFNADLYSMEALSSTTQFENSLLDKYADSFPLKMIHRALRTRTEQQLLWNENDREFYFAKNNIASALCVPILKRKSVIGCIYMENKETKEVFSSDKINLAKLVISISLDNANIFSSINKSYARFLPSEFLKLLGKSHVTKVKLGDAVQREMSVLFSDVYGFTELMEGFSAKDGFAFINLLLKSIAPPISRNGGFIDKILGDGILALFVEPQGAVTAAMEMISELETFNTKNNTNVKLGIGIHHGVLQLGTIGYEQRLDATVISDTVNTASRCESLTRTFHSNILITKAVMDIISVPFNVVATSMGKFILKGKHIPQEIYNVASKGWKTGGHDRDFKLLTKVIDLFSGKEFCESFALAETISKNTKNHTVSAACNLYKEASVLYKTTILPIEWEGEMRLSKDGEVRPFFSK